MYPILARYGPFFLYSYTVVMGLGLLAAVGVTFWRERREVAWGSGWLDGFLWALLLGIVGGRIAFVAANATYFSEHPREAWLVSRGGLSYHGALLFGLVAVLAWTWRADRRFYRYAAIWAPGLVLWTLFGWTACWLDACAYGRETTLGLLASDLPDSYGVFAVRYQTQLIGLLLSLPAFALVWWGRRRWRAATQFWVAVLLVSGARGVVALLRGDPVPMLGSWRLDLVVDGALALVATVALLVLHWRTTQADLIQTEQT